MTFQKLRPKAKKVASSFIQKVADNIYGSVISLIVGAAVATAVFFFTSHITPLEELKKDMQSEVVQRLRQQHLAKHPDQVDFDFMDSYKLSLSSDTIVLRGKFEPRQGREGISSGTKNMLFVAIFEEAPKSWLDSVVGRDARKELTALLTVQGTDEPEVSNLRVEDVFQKGQKAFLFEIGEVYADGRSISPIILFKYADGWKPTLLQNFDSQAQKSIEKLIKEKSVKPSSQFLHDLRGPRTVEVPNITFIEDWELNLNGKPYKFVALRNSSGFKYEQHPAFGYRNLVIVASYNDGPVMDDHRVYVRALKLVSTQTSGAWEDDENWNGGLALVSINPVDFQKLNFDELFNAGFQKVDHATFYGTTFGKEFGKE